jgi:hypothetical protein
MGSLAKGIRPPPFMDGRPATDEGERSALQAIRFRAVTAWAEVSIIHNDRFSWPTSWAMRSARLASPDGNQAIDQPHSATMAL